MSSQLSHAPLGIEIIHSQTGAVQSPPDIFAREWIDTLVADGDLETANRVLGAASEINQVIDVTRKSPDGDEELSDLFTAEQLLEMQGRIHTYLGTDVATHLANPSTPPGYPFYIEKLSTHFNLSEDRVTSSFGSFVADHIDPSETARGPMEQNSREYANIANERMIVDLSDFYQTGYEVKLKGPQKTVQGSRVSWEKGVAECQFLVLDHIRDQLSMGRRSPAMETVAMSPEDLEANIRNLLAMQRTITAQVTEINPLLGQAVEQRLKTLATFTVEVLHRGRLGVERFRKEPAKATTAVANLEALLKEADRMSTVRADQEEIPILDI